MYLVPPIRQHLNTCPK